ncbi:hypothetical protein TRFO_29980 [Tritrichomonas foetus]|uniref:Ras-GEF domain-containing protein n=1 Tax=Tritrichomonas foetus TaxID=1144522 RepID=A0A1J4JWG3_9EUKA|nr:hypothetical protein TRFO_29980 [Tritrichomonas foetus]|eukprot:OHT02784.1 hypothetical protein TRFO_29980 [Tritrichomonas foetus]
MDKIREKHFRRLEMRKILETEETEEDDFENGKKTFEKNPPKIDHLEHRINQANDFFSGYFSKRFNHFLINNDKITDKGIILQSAMPDINSTGAASIITQSVMLTNNESKYQHSFNPPPKDQRKFIIKDSDYLDFMQNLGYHSFRYITGTPTMIYGPKKIPISPDPKIIQKTSPMEEFVIQNPLKFDHLKKRDILDHLADLFQGFHQRKNSINQPFLSYENSFIKMLVSPEILGKKENIPKENNDINLYYYFKNKANRSVGSTNDNTLYDLSCPNQWYSFLKLKNFVSFQYYISDDKSELKRFYNQYHLFLTHYLNLSIERQIQIRNNLFQLIQKSKDQVLQIAAQQYLYNWVIMFPSNFPVDMCNKFDSCFDSDFRGDIKFFKYLTENHFNAFQKFGIDFRPNTSVRTIFIDINKINYQIFAYTVTVAEFELIHSMNIKDLIYFMQSGKSDNIPHIHRIYDHFKYMSTFILRSITQVEANIEYWFNVMKFLWEKEIYNYMFLFEFIAAITNPEIERSITNFTKKQSNRDQYYRFTKIANSDDGFKNYRTSQQDNKSMLKIIPFILPYLSLLLMKHPKRNFPKLTKDDNTFSFYEYQDIFKLVIFIHNDWGQNAIKEILSNKKNVPLDLYFNLVNIHSIFNYEIITDDKEIPVYKAINDKKPILTLPKKSTSFIIYDLRRWIKVKDGYISADEVDLIDDLKKVRIKDEVNVYNDIGYDKKIIKKLFPIQKNELVHDYNEVNIPIEFVDDVEVQKYSPYWIRCEKGFIHYQHIKETTSNTRCAKILLEEIKVRKEIILDPKNEPKGNLITTLKKDTVVKVLADYCGWTKIGLFDIVGFVITSGIEIFQSNSAQKQMLLQKEVKKKI